MHAATHCLWYGMISLTVSCVRTCQRSVKSQKRKFEREYALFVGSLFPLNNFYDVTDLQRRNVEKITNVFCANGMDMELNCPWIRDPPKYRYFEVNGHYEWRVDNQSLRSEFCHSRLKSSTCASNEKCSQNNMINKEELTYLCWILTNGFVMPMHVCKSRSYVGNCQVHLSFSSMERSDGQYIADVICFSFKRLSSILRALLLLGV